MKDNITADELREDLDRFHGSETFYKTILSSVITTEGVNYLAENAECFWLVDAIASWELQLKVRTEPFQVWKLYQSNDLTWKLVCDDGNDNVLATQEIVYSDFPLPEGIQLYACRNELGGITIMLPGEY